MMRGFRDGFRRGVGEAVAGYKRSPRREGADRGDDHPPSEWRDTEAGGEDDALRALEARHEEGKQLIAELAGTVELLQSRVVELIAAAEPMAKVLRLPGVRTWLLQRFHPDKYPDADERQQELLNEAMRAIAAAYAAMEKLQPSED